MNANKVERRTQRRFSLESLGRNPENRRVTQKQILLDGREHEIIALPYDVTRLGSIQDSQGRFIFMLGISGLESEPLA